VWPLIKFLPLKRSKKKKKKKKKKRKPGVEKNGKSQRLKNLNKFSQTAIES
jgi:hypothetical protein